MRLLITGGAGFLSYHVCQLLSPRYSEILALDVAPFAENEYPANVRCLKADVCDRDRLLELSKGVDHIIHAAAGLPLCSSKEIWDVNVAGTRNVLEAAKKNNAGRVVYISSTAVYGVPKKKPIEEADPLIGVGPYGESKIAAEKLCEEYRQKGLCVSTVRPKTFIGTGRLGVFQILFDWVQSGKRIPIIGAGKNRYQLLEVEDLINAIGRLLNAPVQAANDTFNVGAEKFGTVADDVGGLCAYAGSGARVMPVPAAFVKLPLRFFEFLHLSPLYKWVYETADKDSFVSIEKIQKTVQWKPRFSNQEALIRSYQWYREHAADMSSAGTGHRTPWKPGILKIIKKFM